MKRWVVPGVILVTLACASAGKIGKEVPVPAPNEPLAELESRLGSPESAVRAGAAWSLAGAKGVGQGALSTLRDLRRDSEPQVRYAASWALQHLAPGDDSYDQPPKLLEQGRPQYPQLAFDAKLQGTVVVEMLIGETGQVVHAELRTSIPGLDEAALECVRKWRFEPARRAGQPVATVARAPINFRIH